MFIKKLFQNIKKSVGNNMENDIADVMITKDKFVKEGRYRKSVENGYIDQELDSAIRSFQRDYDLKQDGFMNPDGETEQMLHAVLKNPPPKKDSNIRKTVVAVLPPLAYQLAALLSMTAVAAWAHYQSETPEGKRRLREQVSANNQSDEDNIDRNSNKAHCDKMYAGDTTKCSEITREQGTKASAVCRARAMARYASCLSGKSEDEWPDL